MKKVVLLILSVLPLAFVQAETKEHIAAHPHELRIGIGDPLGQVLLKDNGILLFNGTVFPHTDDKAYAIPHIFAEYNYRFGKHFSVGFQFDFVTVWGNDWEEADFPIGSLQQDPWNQYYFNFMPTFKCHYLDRDMISLYSGVGVGFSYAKYKSTITWDWVEGIWNPAKRPVREVFGAALDITVIGVSVGKNHLFGNFELGALLDFETGVRNRVIPSRFISASIGYRF